MLEKYFNWKREKNILTGNYYEPLLLSTKQIERLLLLFRMEYLFYYSGLSLVIDLNLSRVQNNR